MQVVFRNPEYGYLDCSLWVPKSKVNVEGIKNALTFTVMERKSVSVCELWKETAHHLILPREFWDPRELDFPVIDCRVTDFTPVDIRSRIKLDHLPGEDGVLRPTGKAVQRDALQALLSARGGILQLACGLGKSTIALEYIARMRCPAIILVDNSQLLNQWRMEIEAKLEIPGGAGHIQAQTLDWKKSIVLATYQTIAARAETFPEEIRRWFGVVVWDENQHLAATTFAKTADLFYGRRLGLSATPTRPDGLHVVYDYHLGKVLYKNLTQDLRPNIYFSWTGLALDKADVRTRSLTEDKNGELHVGKIAGFFGIWPERLNLILTLVREALDENRKVLVLSNSIDELVNLKALWDQQDLYTDIPFPDPSEIGETRQPVELDEVTTRRHQRLLGGYYGELKDTTIATARRQELERRVAASKELLAQGEVWKKLDAIHRKRQREHVKRLVDLPSTAGLMIYQVPTAIRSRLLKEKKVVFAVSKYGREGLDSPDLDTIIAAEPMSSRNALQQFMGRVLRKKPGKQTPVVVFLEDNIGPMIGMCQNLRRHLREWPTDEGGPYSYECVGHSDSFKRQGNQWIQNTKVFGPSLTPVPKRLSAASPPPTSTRPPQAP